jgi:hemerythrin superfamily protein
MADDVVSLITADHRRVEELCERLRSPEEDRDALTRLLSGLFTAHSRAEEECVYPEVVHELPGEEGRMAHSEEEHHEVEQVLREMAGAIEDDERFLGLLEQAVEMIGEHVRTEESEVLPALREAVDRRRLTELGTAFGRRREEVLRERPEGVNDVAELSRDELYEEARRRDVPGRSQLRKDELADAVREERERDE